MRSCSASPAPPSCCFLLVPFCLPTNGRVCALFPERCLECDESPDAEPAVPCCSDLLAAGIRLLYWNNCNTAPSVRSSHGDAGAHHIERMTWLPHLGQVSSQGSRNALHRPQNLGVSVSSGGTGDPQREQNSRPSIV